MANRTFYQFSAVTYGTVPPINPIARYTCPSRALTQLVQIAHAAEGELLFGILMMQIIF